MTTIEMTVLRPADELGPVLTGRSAAARLNLRIERAASLGNEVVIDLAGVHAMSPSFADELFGKLPQSITDLVRFENVGPELEPLVRFVRAGRPRPGNGAGHADLKYRANDPRRRRTIK